MASAARRMKGSSDAPMPLEQARLPVHADDIHLILQHQARAAEQAPRCEQLGGAEERVVQVQQVEAPARARICGRQAALPRLNSGVSSTTVDAGRMPRAGSCRAG